MMRIRTIGFFFCLSTLLAQAPPAADPAQGLVLSNRHARLEFAPKGMGLIAMTDVASGRNHLEAAKDGGLLWRLTLGRGTLSRALTNNEKPCNYARLETLSNGTRRAVMEWNDMRFWLENKAVTVRVVVDLPPDSGIAQWRIQVANHSDYWGLQKVEFPIVTGFPAAGAYDVAHPVFASGGVLLRKRTEPLRGRSPSGLWPMQFFSLSRGRDSVYVGSRDPEGRAKDFLTEPGKQVSITHYPENLSEAGSGWPDYYAVEFGVFQGSWIEAARHYREWAIHQKWTAAGRLSQRTVPTLAKNASFWARGDWVWKGTTSGGGAAPSLQELNAPLLEAKDQMGVTTAFHWYNWHHAPFDNLYPHFLPAKEGFAERVKELVSRGILVMPYINGSSADMNIPDWNRFAPYANVDEAGGFRHHFYSESAGRLLTMCPSQGFWQETIEQLVERLVGELGVNGVYVDQVSAMEHELCFHRGHGHPLGGGHYWADGNRDLLRRVRQVADRAGREVTITSEGANEMFLDLVDSNLTWAPPSATEIPLMQLVYSGYTLFFGSPCDYCQSDRFFRYAQGQALIDGRQNGWMDLKLFAPQYAVKVNFLKACARLRAAQGKYLTYGRMLEPVYPLDAVPTFEEGIFGWKHNERGSVPLAEARLWQAEDGSLAVFFANYGDQRVPFRYRIDPASFGAKGSVINKTETLEPASVRMVELGR